MPILPQSSSFSKWRKVPNHWLPVLLIKICLDLTSWIKWIHFLITQVRKCIMISFSLTAFCPFASPVSVQMLIPNLKSVNGSSLLIGQESSAQPCLHFQPSFSMCVACTPSLCTTPATLTCAVLPSRLLCLLWAFLLQPVTPLHISAPKSPKSQSPSFVITKSKTKMSKTREFCLQRAFDFIKIWGSETDKTSSYLNKGRMGVTKWCWHGIIIEC